MSAITVNTWLRRLWSLELDSVQERTFQIESGLARGGRRTVATLPLYRQPGVIAPQRRAVVAGRGHAQVQIHQPVPTRH